MDKCNFGQAIKIYAGEDVKKGIKKYYYGRYFGRGREGRSTQKSPDYELICLLLPNNTYVYSRRAEFVEDAEELANLEKTESLYPKPYGGRLTKLDNNVWMKTDQKLFKNQDLYKVSTKLYGEGLAKVISSVLGKTFYYQVVKAVYRAPRTYYSTTIDGRKERALSILSPNRYPDEYFSREFSFPIHPTLFSPQELWENSDNIFENENIEIKRGDILIYEGEKEAEKMAIGRIQNFAVKPQPFTVNSEEVAPLKRTKFNKKVNEVATQFAKNIIIYKVANNKLDLNEEDFDKISQDLIAKYNESEDEMSND